MIIENKSKTEFVEFYIKGHVYRLDPMTYIEINDRYYFEAKQAIRDFKNVALHSERNPSIWMKIKRLFKKIF